MRRGERAGCDEGNEGKRAVESTLQFPGKNFINPLLPRIPEAPSPRLRAFSGCHTARYLLDSRNPEAGPGNCRDRPPIYGIPDVFPDEITVARRRGPSRGPRGFPRSNRGFTILHVRTSNTCTFDVLFATHEFADRSPMQDIRFTVLILTALKGDAAPT